jgi:penicillin-binding protein A
VIDLPAQRRRRLTHRGLPALVGLAALALGVGFVVGSLPSGAERTTRDFGRAWQRGDIDAMYDLLGGGSRSRYSKAAFQQAYRQAAATATATRVRVGSPKGTTLPVVVRTRIFGPVRGKLRLPVAEDHVDWEPQMTFPGVRRGEGLRRRSFPPDRAALLSRGGRVLAEGPAHARRSPIVGVGAQVGGSVEPEKTKVGRRAVYARGFPRSWPVGQTGLERVFERDVAGRPGGELLAGSRILARAAPRRGPAIRTTIDVNLEQAAIKALGGRFGGIAALDARNGEVRALAGIAFSAPQPPGSTFKIVTTTAALEARAVKPSSSFPVQTQTLIDGVPLANANGESCGGTFKQSFAQSCNSVFAPLGVKVGAKRLVSAAERYGFNAPPSVPGEAPSTLPPAHLIRTPLEVGSTAIGQFKDLATPLRLASMAQAVSAGGVRNEPTLRAGDRGRRPVRVTSRRVASVLTKLMVDVVGYGTGTSAAIPGVKVAGKTGTAELKNTRGPLGSASDPKNTDAWFTAFAPAERPRIAAAAMFVKAGAGGRTAAPAVRQVLAAALGK